MAAPTGNTNASKGRQWSEAVKRAIRAKYGKDWDESLQELALELVKAAAGGDLQALKEIGDRIDGKPAQSVDLGSDPDRPLINKVVREIVRPPNPDGSGI